MSKIPDYDVVAVHGLYSGLTSPWGEQCARLTKNLIPSRRVRVMTYDYHTSDSLIGIYTKKQFSDQATKFLGKLLEWRSESENEARRPLIVVAHDIGAIIVKEALILASLDPTKFEYIHYSVFLGCPHRCTSIQDMEEKLTRLLLVRPRTDSNSMTRVTQLLTESIVEINNTFIDTNLFIKLSIINVFSSAKDSTQQVFDYFTATLNIPFEGRVLSDNSHMDLMNILDSDENPVNKYLERASYLSTKMFQYLPTVLSQASPVHPQQVAHDPQNPISELSWIGEDKIFTNWLTKRDTDILHIYGTSNIFAAGEYIFQLLDSLIGHATDHPILYFEFKLHDNRFNTLNSMLSTFLAQIMSHFTDLENSAIRDLEFLFHHKSWSSKDLYSFWNGLRGTRRIDSITYVIHRLDLCDEPFDWFLKDLLSFSEYSESRYKLVIISRTSQNIQDVLSESRSINIDCHGETDVGETDGLSPDLVHSMAVFELAALVQERPQYSSFESTLAKLLFECGNDIPLCRLITDWLRFGKQLDKSLEIERRLEDLSPACLNNVLEKIMLSMNKDKQDWAHTIIALVSCSFRPLTLLELQATLAAQVSLEGRETERIVPSDILTELHQCFGSVFIVQDGEVRFSHSDARDFFIPSESSTQKDYSWFKFEEHGIAHAVNVSFCLTYLAVPKVQKQIAEISSRPNDLQQSPVSNIRTDLLSYALRYWPDHYKVALSNSPESEFTKTATQAVSRFFEDSEAAILWAKSYYRFSNPFMRPEKPLSSILPVFSSLGLYAFVQKYLSESHPEDSDSLSRALIEAARGDHSDILDLLLDCFHPSQSTLRDALKAAATCPESKSLTRLLEYVSRLTERFEWHQDLLYRAAWLGLENVVKQFFGSGTEFNPPEKSDQMSPLHLAARNNHIGVAKTLLEQNANLAADALHYACTHGHPEIIRLIGENSDFESKDESGWTPMKHACHGGHYLAVEALLKAGANKNYHEDEYQLLAVATQCGYFKCSQSLLRHGANLKSSAPSPSLIPAVQVGSIELVELFLEYGADINEEDNGFTALSLATKIGSKDMVSYLIDKKANVNLPEEAFKRPVYVAAGKGYHELLQLLIENGADVNIFTTNGWGPLHIAYDHPEIARVLLENGVDLNRASDAGTPLHLASKWNYPEVMKVYLKYKPNLEITIDSNDYYRNMAALCVATAQGNIEIVRMLLEQGANVDQRAQFNYYPLQYAFCLSSTDEAVDIMKILIEYNASLNLRDDGGNTALHYIRSYTPVSVIKVLINAGADMEVGDKFGFTPICNAIKYKNRDAMKYLLSKGAKVNLVGGSWGGGPLHLACFLGLLEFIKILIENGADVNLANPGSAGTPLTSVCSGKFDDNEVTEREGKNEKGIYGQAKAREKQLGIPEGMTNPHVEAEVDRQEGLQMQIVRYLVEDARANVNASGGSYGFALNTACLKSSSDIVELLLEKGARTDVEDALGRRPIHFAAFRTLNHFELMIGSVTHLSIKDKLGLLPLHYAVASGRAKVVKRVLKLSDGHVNEPDCDNWTPLFWAARTCGRWKTTTQEKPEIIQLLMNAGADLWVRGSGLDREWSPLKVARYYGADEEVINLLTPKSKERVKHGRTEQWEERFHLSRKAIDKRNILCDGCLHGIWGIHFKCSKCSAYDLCFKCYRSRNTIHPGHSFQDIGPEYEPGSTESSKQRSVMDEDDEEEDEETEEETDDDEDYEDEDEDEDKDKDEVD